MAENLISSPAYRVAFSMYVALGGDPNMTFDSVDAIYAEIDELYGKGTRVTIENLSVEITENGGYLYDNEEITGYKPVSVNVSVPQKYTDEQVESLKETARQEGYDSGYDLGVADGYTQGESEGYNDGYAEGLEDGAEDQKALLEAVTFTENGTYTKEDGYNEVTVAVDIPTFETEELSVELTANGTYNYTPTTDGYSKVDVTVNVASSGGGGSVDLTMIGYSTEVNDAYNAHMTDGLAYAQSIIEEFNGTASTSGNSKYEDNTNLVYFPNIDTNFTDMRYMFKNCNNLQMVDIKNNGAQMRECFDGCTDVKSIKLSHSISVGHYVFRNCCNLTNLEITKSGGNIYNDSDINNYAYFSNAFENCYNLETFPNVYINGWMGIYLSGMFKNCKKMKVAPTISYGSYYKRNHFMSEMFMGCESLLQVPTMQRAGYAATWTSAFEGCTSLVDTAMTYDISPDSYTPGDIKLSRCFYNCKSLTVAPVVSANGRNTHTDYMYYNCTSLTTPFQWYNNCVNAEYMYYNCTSLTKMTGSSINLNNCENVRYMFGGCSKLTNIGTYSNATFTNLGMVENLVGTDTMFYNCSALTYATLVSIIDGLYDRATAGYPVLTLTLGNTNIVKLSEDEIAIATNKGWILA